MMAMDAARGVSVAAKDPPCNAAEAVARAQAMVRKGGQYILGTGDYWPHKEADATVDLPWTYRGGKAGSDCAGFAVCYAWKLQRHRPGFNRGAWSTVADDINSDSALQDATHRKELFDVFTGPPKPGDLIIYPSIWINGHRFIGHVGLVETVPDQWDPGKPDYSLLSVIQCHGPNGFTPGVVRTDGSVWQHHDHIWPKPQHRTQIIRPKERK